MRRRLTLGQLARLMKAQEAGPTEFHECVRRLHVEEGVTYQAIANELGTSRQWVHKVKKKAETHNEKVRLSQEA